MPLFLAPIIPFKESDHHNHLKHKGEYSQSVWNPPVTSRVTQPRSAWTMGFAVLPDLIQVPSPMFSPHNSIWVATSGFSTLSSSFFFQDILLNLTGHFRAFEFLLSSHLLNETHHEFSNTVIHKAFRILLVYFCYAFFHTIYHFLSFPLFWLCLLFLVVFSELSAA